MVRPRVKSLLSLQEVRGLFITLLVLLMGHLIIILGLKPAVPLSQAQQLNPFLEYLKELGTFL